MKLPPHIDQNEFQEAILKIMSKIRTKYCFVQYDGDDLAQQAFFIAIDEKVIGKYDPSVGPLYNFLSVAVNNRIKNYIRDTLNVAIKTTSISNVEEETIKIGNMRTSDDEFWSIIDEHLSADYRQDYLKMRQGISIPKVRRLKLIAELRRIIDECL